MIIDTGNPEVADLLKAWFRERDALFDIRSQDEISPSDWEGVDALLDALVEIGDELVGLLCPTAAERAKVTESDLPRLTRGESSHECLEAGLNCSIDPRTGKCTECGQEEKL